MQPNPAYFTFIDTSNGRRWICRKCGKVISASRLDVHELVEATIDAGLRTKRDEAQLRLPGTE